MAGAESGPQHDHHPCIICMEPMAPSEAHRGGAACAHAFCRACLSGHVRAKVEAGAVAGGGVVRCPEPSCAGALDPELCRVALASGVFERWCAELCEALFPAARRTYCPFPDCSEMMVADDGSEVCVTQSECQVCRRLFCARCRVAPWHAGVTCDEYQQLAEVDRGREDMMLLEMAKGNEWKRCPSCKFIVEKIDGCTHIRCRCGFEFCYKCGMARSGMSHSCC
ncbi:unnamed protein product [Urochloa humidicola]